MVYKSIISRLVGKRPGGNTMRKLLKPFLLASVLCFGLAAVSAGAMPNPAPAILHDDSGAQLFASDPALIGVKAGGDPFVEFGFFYAFTPLSLHPIFTVGDPVGSAAFVDFTNGRVFNLTTSSLTSVFAPLPNPIGFYTIFLAESPLLISTLNVLNPLDADLAGTFQVIGSDNLLLLFVRPLAQGLDFAFDVVAGIRPIPEPSTWPLLALGLSVLWLRPRRPS